VGAMHTPVFGEERIYDMEHGHMVVVSRHSDQICTTGSSGRVRAWSNDGTIHHVVWPTNR
jgi:hypothetical protein